MSANRILAAPASLLLLLFGFLGAPPLVAQEGSAAGIASTPAELSPAAVGTVVVAHGADAAWNAPVLAAAAATETGGPVEVAFLMGDSVPAYRFQDAVHALEARGVNRVVVVPLLASSHSGHYEQIRWLAGEVDELSETMMHHLEMGGIRRPESSVPLTLTPALDASREIAEVLTERARALATEPTEQALFVIGHGPNGAEDHARWMANLRPIAEEVAARVGFRDVKLGMVRDDAPDAVREEAVRSIREVITLQHELTGREVVTVPILVSRGYVSQVKLPRDLAGLEIVWDGEGMLPHPAVSRWIERRVREATEAVRAAEGEGGGLR